jgi:hypothetical protein
MSTSNDGATAYLQLITLQIDANSVFYNLTVALGLVGLTASLARKGHLLPLWFLIPYLIDPRSAPGISFIPLAMLAAIGFDQVLAPALLAIRDMTNEWIQDRFVLRTLFAILIYLTFSAGIFGVRLAATSLSESDRDTMRWAEENIDPGSSFLLLTGEQYSMKDPFQEWFPALTPHASQTTLQGLEWMLGSDFFPRYGELVALQHCADVTCISDWSQRTGLEHRYLLVKVPAGSSTPMATSLRQLLESVRGAAEYKPVYRTDAVVIFERSE